MDTRISKDLGFISHVRGEKLITLHLPPVGRAVNMACTTMACEHSPPERGLKKKWVLLLDPQDHSVYTW